ncbi:MAG: hypothetical protein R3E83_06285 [Burkholderiaceae bacterium]
MSEARVRPARALLTRIGVGAGAVLAVIGVVLALTSATSPRAVATTPQAVAEAASTGVPVPHPVVDKNTRCVAPVGEIRRNHMEMLRHQRDRTLREGVRGEAVSLNACVQCHATPQGPDGVRSVLGGPDAFCQGCHEYAAVRIDCFECHQARATGAAPQAAGSRP